MRLISLNRLLKISLLTSKTLKNIKLALNIGIFISIFAITATLISIYYETKINTFLFSKIGKDEILITNFSGENSQFIRFNNSKVRQTGIVDDILIAASEKELGKYFTIIMFEILQIVDTFTMKKSIIYCFLISINVCMFLLKYQFLNNLNF